MFIREEGELFTRSVETHVQRAYSVDELKKAAEEAGLKWLGAWDSDTEDDIGEDSARYLVVLQENGKL